VEKRKVVLSLRFDHTLIPAEIASIEKAGVELKVRNGAPVHVGPVYSAEAAWDAVPGLALIPGLVRAEPAWRPVIVRPLDKSIPEIGASTAWNTHAPDGAGGITGRGIVIADVDTGVDWMHPAFFFDDGGEFDWIDTDGDGKFTPGKDAVDLNRNGKKDPGETLNFIGTDVKGAYGDDPPDGKFHIGRDWLYNDANDNGKRDMGAPEFGEDSPGYGEPIFSTRDPNRDGSLNPGEKLNMLKTCKVKIIRSPSGDVFRRGQNLLSAPTDTEGHGTGAASVALGGQVGMKYVGIAPGAELMAIDNRTDSFDFVSSYQFAFDEGADVILHEYSNWIFGHMDGSSNEEVAIQALSDQGVISSIPAGNLTGAKKHGKVNVPAGGKAVLEMQGVGNHNYVYISIHFVKTAAKDISLKLNDVALPVDGTFVTVGDDAVWSAGDTSPAGTHRVDIYIENTSAPVSKGPWNAEISNAGTAAVTAHGFATDESSGWGQGFGFKTPDEHYTVTWPSNGAGGISVASYNTRYSPIGNVSGFSGRGPRIDGVMNLEIAAPGGYDLLAPASQYGGMGNGTFGSYSWYGGTSGAGPHVAGAIALARQAFKGAKADDVRSWMTAGAKKDTYTGTSLPDNTWGYGKLNVPGMLKAAGYDGGLIDAGWDAGFDAGLDAGTDGGSPIGDGGVVKDGSKSDGGEPDNPAGCSCASAGL
jgi:hypothetical protein